MLNVDSTLRSTRRDSKKYERQAMEAEKILDRQFGPAINRRLASLISRQHALDNEPRIQTASKKRISIRTEEDPTRVIAWAIAQRVREARESQGHRQEDLANMTGIARPNIVRIEQGRHVPALITLKKIADALNLDISSLTAEPEVTEEERREFAEMAESGVAEWRESLTEEDKRG